MKSSFAVIFVFLLCSYAIYATARRIDLNGDVFAKQNVERRADKRAVYQKIMFQVKKNNRQKATQPADVTALKAFYHSTGGQSWVKNTNWMSGDPCTNQWVGIYCDEDGYVLSITLVYNNVSGEIPKELTLAKRLQAVILYDNAITKPIPEAIYTMDSLQSLELSYNQIPGELPKTMNMPSMESLSLGSNMLHGPLPTSWNAPKLQLLDLNSNSFTGVLPNSLADVRTLKTLYLSINDLRGEYPDSWGNLKSLELLWLFQNKGLKGPFPSSWAALTSLQSVSLEQMTGSFPGFFGEWRSLTFVQIVRGSLMGSIPSNFCNLRNLKTLWLFQNNITGEIPSCIGQNPLVDLELSNNFFSGSIPSSIGDASPLVVILLDSNKLSGNLPDSLSRLVSLKSLRVSNNPITGSIPDLGNCRNMTNLELSQCQFTGHIPNSLGNLVKLEVLDLCQNRLTGCVPSSLNNLVDLADFSLCYNTLNCVENGLENLFERIKNYGCFLYNNPWTCPLPSFVPSVCSASCSACNNATSHNDCSSCVKSSTCGFCNGDGNVVNCLDGTKSGPELDYYCPSQYWTYGEGSC